MTTVRADDKSRMRSYDPLRHGLIDRARLRHLEPILQTGAHRISASLSLNLRRPVRVEIGQVEQNSWEEFRSEVEDPTFVATGSLSGLNERIVLHFPAALILSLVEVKLGGDGQSPTDRSTLTDIEFSMAGSFATVVLSALQASLETVLEASIVSVQSYRSVHYVKMSHPNESCVRVAMPITIGDSRVSDTGIYFPAAVVGTMIEAIELLQGEEVEDTKMTTKNIERRLLSVPVEVLLAYPPVKISATDLLSIRVGEVIPLDRGDQDESDLDIMIGTTRIGHALIVNQEGRRCTCSVSAWERRSTT